VSFRCWHPSAQAPRSRILRRTFIPDRSRGKPLADGRACRNGLLEGSRGELAVAWFWRTVSSGRPLASLPAAQQFVQADAASRRGLTQALGA